MTTVINRELADQPRKQQDQFAVGFLPVLDDAFNQGAKQFGIVFQDGVLGFELRYAERQFMPA